LIGLKVSYNLV